MSDFDGGNGYDTGYENGHENYEAGHESGALDQQHEAFGNQHESVSQYQQYGHEQGFENDENFENGKHVEYTGADGSHYEETEFTSYNSHEAGYESEYGESSLNAESDSSWGEMDSLSERFQNSFATLDRGYETGTAELAAK